MFMHIVSIKCGPAAAGIIISIRRGALYTEGVQTDEWSEVPVCFKVAGHYRGGKGWSALQSQD